MTKTCGCYPCDETSCRSCEFCSTGYVSSHMPDYWETDEISSAIRELWHSSLDWQQWQAIMDACEERNSNIFCPFTWVDIARELMLPLPKLSLEVWMEQGPDPNISSTELALKNEDEAGVTFADYVFDVEDLSRYLDDTHISMAIDELESI